MLKNIHQGRHIDTLYSCILVFFLSTINIVFLVNRKGEGLFIFKCHKPIKMLLSTEFHVIPVILTGILVPLVVVLRGDNDRLF